jgi:hypothetical protein
LFLESSFSMAIDLSSVERHSSGKLLFSAVSFACMGGIGLGEGIQQSLKERSTQNWIVSFIFGLAFLAFGIFWAVILMRRLVASPKEQPVARSHERGALQ